jgi:hypothetical protein
MSNMCEDRRVIRETIEKRIDTITKERMVKIKYMDYERTNTVSWRKFNSEVIRYTKNLQSLRKQWRNV